jgi:predicted transposase/invertase (TIGR01784 family)
MQSNPMRGDSGKNDHAIIRSRSIYNLCDLHSTQPSRGVRYDKLARTYQITFCRYTVFPDLEQFVNRFAFRTEAGRLLHDAVGIVYVELSKLKEVMKKAPADMTPLEAFSVFLAVADQEKHKELLTGIIKEKEEIKLASEILATMSKDPDEIARFLSRRRYERDREHERAVLRDEGLAEGLTKGRTEGHKEIARNLLADGDSIDRVMRLTGLSKTELESLL